MFQIVQDADNLFSVLHQGITFQNFYIALYNFSLYQKIFDTIGVNTCNRNNVDCDIQIATWLTRHSSSDIWRKCTITQHLPLTQI